MFQFVNPEVQKRYRAHTGQADTEIIIPRLGWRSKLSRITPRIAEEMLAGGTNILERITEVVEPLQQATPPKRTRKKPQTK